jgi:hypothetical protein
VIGCTQLGHLRSVFPAAGGVGFTQRDGIKVQEARQPVWPGRCGAFWTTYSGSTTSGDKETVDVTVTLYKSTKGVDAAFAEPQKGAVHVLANGSRVRTGGPSPGSVNGTPSSSTVAASAFRNLFIESISISTTMTPVPVSEELRLHRLIENRFARLHR